MMDCLVFAVRLACLIVLIAMYGFFCYLYGRSSATADLMEKLKKKGGGDC